MKNKPEIQQRSDEWQSLRVGKFTASEIHKLLGIKGIGKTGESYVFEKAVESVFGKDEDDNFTSFDMQRGIDLEPFAFKKFQEIKRLDFIDVEESLFFPYGTSAGASPDGVVGNDAILEIKCPKAIKFFNLMVKGKEEIDKEYIAQMQMQMLCSNSSRCHFFNYLIFKGQEYFFEIIVDRDEAMIEIIKERIALAIELKQEYVNQLITK